MKNLKSNFYELVQILWLVQTKAQGLDGVLHAKIKLLKDYDTL